MSSMERPRSHSNASHRSSATAVGSQPPAMSPPTSGNAPEAASSSRSDGKPVHGSSKATPSRVPRVCRVCGQHHSHHEPHLYNYESEVDEDLMCQICLQPFVQPVDTPCGHTFCHACLNNYMKVNPSCPLDRKPVNEMTVSPTNLVLKR